MMTRLCPECSSACLQRGDLDLDLDLDRALALFFAAVAVGAPAAPATAGMGKTAVSSSRYASMHNKLFDTQM